MMFLSTLSHHNILFSVETHLTTEENYNIKAILGTFEEKQYELLVMFLCLCDLLFLNLLNLLHFPHSSEGWVASAIVEITA